MGPGDVIGGRYRLSRPLGRGGMATVWEAADEAAGTIVAVKLLLERRLGQDEAVERFRREARAAARVGSRFVVFVSEAGVLPDGEPYMVMERLDGEPLSALLDRRGRLPPVELVPLVLQACEAIGAAHACGIVHRDLKPENLFVVRGETGEREIRVVDFGMAKVFDVDGAPLTQTGVALGTPQYMAPEQLLDSKNVDARADVYGLGVILYESLSGRLPYRAKTLSELVRMVVTEDPAPLCHTRPDLQPLLCDVVMRAIAREPDERFPTVRALAEHLAQIDVAWRAPAPGPAASAPGAPALTAAPAPGAPERAAVAPPARAPRRRLVVALVAVAVAAFFGAAGVAAGLVLLATENRAAPPATPRADASPPATGADRFAGQWRGEGRQSDGTTWPVVLELTGAAPGTCGTIIYPPLSCRGVWVCSPGAGAVLRATEHIVPGSGPCATGMTIEASIDRDGHLAWRGEARGIVAWGLLARAP
jgi:serine/threonine-protein kinase